MSKRSLEMTDGTLGFEKSEKVVVLEGKIESSRHHSQVLQGNIRNLMPAECTPTHHHSSIVFSEPHTTPQDTVRTAISLDHNYSNYSKLTRQCRKTRASKKVPLPNHQSISSSRSKKSQFELQMNQQIFQHSCTSRINNGIAIDNNPDVSSSSVTLESVSHRTIPICNSREMSDPSHCGGSFHRVESLNISRIELYNDNEYPSLTDSNANLATPNQMPIRPQTRNRFTHDVSGTVSIVSETNRISEHYSGPMNIECVHCKALHFTGEKVSNKGNSFNDCCSHGKVFVENLPRPPEILIELFNGTHEKSNHFYQNIRYYNNSFSIASFNANLVGFNNRRPGPYCFKIQGQIYYQINTSLYPAAGELPSYGQLFIIDSNEATGHRLNSNSHLDAEILQAIDNALRQCNIHVQSYQMMNEELELMTAANNGIEPELELLFTLKKGLDRRRYNFQRVNEVAAVYSTTADGEIPESYVTIRNRSDKVLQYVSSMSEFVEPWTYPLFYPHGTEGWTEGMKQNDGIHRLTRNAYFKYRMAIRAEPNYILKGRRLFQQWTVDSYVKMEKDKMQYLRSIQKKLRVDCYEGVIEHLQRRAQNTNSRIGKICILPSSHTGSPRYMLQIYQDSMTIVRHFGKPDLFITMTCNPKWREITENLLDGQTASDRPDLVARIFELKKNELIRLITKEKIFGDVQAYMHVIEYQKRGLPHVHLLLILKPNSKITSPIIVDKYISAEITSATENPELHDIIKNNMVHGPCGDWCLDEKRQCSKKYPKTFQNETTMDEDGYPSYRRRNTGQYTRRDGFQFDNRSVVPHNKELLQRLNCHINVEVVSNIKAVKYLYKYIYKGPDAAAIVVQESNTNSDQGVINHDEIKDYLETRYVSPPEACARIFNFHMHDKSHSITRLSIHLPGQQTIMIDEIDNDAAIQGALRKNTTLNAYFILNQHDVESKNYTYAEIPQHYTFKKENGEWIWGKRKSHFNVIGRIYSVSPTQTELFHLRLLLTHVKGATSFEDLRTVNGITHPTFMSTCLALGLIEDDNEWMTAMHEAEIWMMPRQLRRLFVRILIHCKPVHPEELWEEFKDSLAEDYSRTMSLDRAHLKAYVQINTLLIDEGSSLENFPTMTQINDVDDIQDNMLPEQHRVIGIEQYQKLNEKQKHVVDTVLIRIVNNTIDHESRCIFIDGPGGSGKTFVYTTLYHLLHSQQKKICTMAYTGIAATLLPSGKTVHKTFKLPIALYNDSSPTIKVQSTAAEYLRGIDMFIWDEAPMAPRHALELIDRTLRDIMNNDQSFGGKIMLLGGDFRQLLPVKKYATRSELVNLSIKFSPLWHEFTRHALTENMRTLPEEIEFTNFLLAVGDGIININDCDLCLPENSLAPLNADIVEDIYGDVIRNEDYEKLTKWAILSARNNDVDDINKRIVELLDGSTERIYKSINSVKECDNGIMAETLLPEYLETLNPPNFPPHELKLRINAVVMLIRNLSVNEGLCNGTRLRILELSNHLLKCKILTGDKAGDIVFICRITLYHEDTYPFVFGRRQFPIRLAFAMTINKSQGQTFEKIGIDLRRDIFNHGQLYVALSRVRSWDSLKIYLGDQRESRMVKNYVYAESYD